MNSTHRIRSSTMAPGNRIPFQNRGNNPNLGGFSSSVRALSRSGNANRRLSKNDNRQLGHVHGVDLEKPIHAERVANPTIQDVIGFDKNSSPVIKFRVGECKCPFCESTQLDDGLSLDEDVLKFLSEGCSQLLLLIPNQAFV